MKLEIEIEGEKHRLVVHKGPQGHRLELDGQPCAADICLLQPGILSILLNGRSYRVLEDPRPNDERALVWQEKRIPYIINDPRSLRSGAGAAGDEAGARNVSASMPGRIVRILVQPGDTVEAQQGLIVVEAMKMQNELKAPKAGKIARVAVEVGATVQAGSVLLVIES